MYSYFKNTKIDNTYIHALILKYKFTSKHSHTNIHIHK